MPKEYFLPVTEMKSFEEAWNAASYTRESFEFYQGMEQKIGYIKKANRWFVTEDKKLWYSYTIEGESLRIIKEASPISCLSNNAFQYVQIMVPKDIGFGRLRFSGQYSGRADAENFSKQSEVFAFNK